MTAMLADVCQPMTDLFPVRVPEESEPMTPEESSSLAGWQESPEGRGVYRAMATHIAAQLDASTERLLTVGDGEGLLSARLAEALVGVEVVGTDVCPEVIARAVERHAAPNLRYEVASVYDLPVAEYDAVVCMFTFHHFHEPERALGRMIDALRPGGRLYVMDLRRDAHAGSYFRWIDTYVQIALPVAPLFRASIRAAHTTAEWERMLEAHAGRGEVGRVRWGAAARAAFEAECPDGLEAFLPDADGLWIEARYRKERSS